MLFHMKFLKGFSINLLVGLNVFILFLLIFETEIVVPAALGVVGRMHPLVLHFPIVLLLLALLLAWFRHALPMAGDAKDLLMSILLFSCSLCSAITVVLGLLLSREDGYTGDVLFWHKWVSVGMSGLVTLSLYAYERCFHPKIVKVLLAAGSLLLLIGGHFGATLTHGDNFLTGPVSKDESNPGELSDARVYADLVEPVLREKCFNCHNPDKAKGQLIMTDIGALKNGGKSGALFTVGKSGQSLFIERLSLAIDHKHRMPPKGKPQLTETELGLIREWVETGASFSVKLAEIPKSGKIHALAATIYGQKSHPIFDFDAADENVVQGLNTNSRIVTPLSYASPALSVRFFNTDKFHGKALEELQTIEKQIVELNLSGTEVNDQDLMFVTRFVNLTRLNLSNTKITDQGLAAIAGLKKLESIMIIGTGVTIEGLQPVVTLPKLNHIYAWNTTIEPDQAQQILKSHPRIRIETSPAKSQSEVLNLSPPQMIPSTAFFRKPFMLNFSHAIKGTEFSYTLDGSDPDSTNPQRFSEPFRISTNTVVKVKAVKLGWGNSKVVEKNYQMSSIKPDRYALLNFPDASHKGNGIATLFDLAEGSTDILYASDGKWLGYRDQDFVAELEFEHPQLLREVIFNTLANVPLQSFPPEEVQIWIMDKTDKASLAVKVIPERAAKDTPVQHNMIKCKMDPKIPVSRMRIVIRPLGKIPAWHANKGASAWLFLDEILIN
jgi:uncharacterized membrane protein